MIIIITILAVFRIMSIIVILYFGGKNNQKKAEKQNAQLRASAQNVGMLIIDKKRMKMKESGLPQVVIEQTPKKMRNSKLPIVKVKIVPKVMNLIADENIFDKIHTKKEVKAVVSGIYIIDILNVQRQEKSVENYEIDMSKQDKILKRREDDNKRGTVEFDLPEGDMSQPVREGAMVALKDGSMVSVHSADAKRDRYGVSNVDTGEQKIVRRKDIHFQFIK